MKKNKIKKIITISGIVLLLIATLGTFAAFFGKQDFAKLKDKWNETFNQETIVESVNLLQNSNFAQDSTGITFKTHENVVHKADIVDNWIRQGSTDSEFEIYSSETGLHINVTNVGTSQDGFVIQQYFEREFGKISDMPLTFAVSVNGIVYSETFEFNDENTSEYLYYPLVESLKIGFCYLEATSAGYKVIFKVLSPAEFTINWVHLEKGNVFTGYIPPVISE